MVDKITSWWTEGNRKFLAAVVALLVFGAVAITLLITQPEGVDLMEFLQWAGGLLFGGQGLFSLANLFEHKIKANTPANTLGKAGLVLAMLLVLLPLTSCSAPSSYVPMLKSSLDASQTLTKGAQAQAIQTRSLVACLASGALLSALETSDKALESWGQEEPGSYTIPGVSVDVSACKDLAEGFKPLVAGEAAARVRGYMEGLAPLALTVTRAAVGAAGLECRDRMLVLAVLSYLEGALRPVVEELEAPDGLMVVEAVVVDVGGCGG